MKSKECSPQLLLQPCLPQDVGSVEFVLWSLCPSRRLHQPPACASIISKPSGLDVCMIHLVALQKKEFCPSVLCGFILYTPCHSPPIVTALRIFNWLSLPMFYSVGWMCLWTAFRPSPWTSSSRYINILDMWIIPTSFLCQLIHNFEHVLKLPSPPVYSMYFLHKFLWLLFCDCTQHLSGITLWSQRVVFCCHLHECQSKWFYWLARSYFRFTYMRVKEEFGPLKWILCEIGPGQ